MTFLFDLKRLFKVIQFFSQLFFFTFQIVNRKGKDFSFSLKDENTGDYRLSLDMPAKCYSLSHVRSPFSEWRLLCFTGKLLLLLLHERLQRFINIHRVEIGIDQNK
jgi:hypothetical protein